jgi:hypothetical protein
LETGALSDLATAPTTVILGGGSAAESVRRLGEHVFDMRRRSQIDFESAMTLMEAGRSDSEIARLTGIPRSTIVGWRQGRGISYHRRAAVANSSWRPLDPPAYCYLLGAYLGDGCMSVSVKGSASLVVTLDSAYPRIVTELTPQCGPCSRTLQFGRSLGRREV